MRREIVIERIEESNVREIEERIKQYLDHEFATPIAEAAKQAYSLLAHSIHMEKVEIIINIHLPSGDEAGKSEEHQRDNRISQIKIAGGESGDS